MEKLIFLLLTNIFFVSVSLARNNYYDNHTVVNVKKDTNKILSAIDLLANKSIADSKDTILFKAVDKVQIQTIGSNNIPTYISILSVFISIVSICIIIRDKFSPAKLFVKILSIHSNFGVDFKGKDSFGNVVSYKGTAYFLTLNLTALGNNFSYRDIKIKIKYLDDPKEYTGRIYWSASDSWQFSSTERKKLYIEPKEFLLFNSALDKDKVIISYLTFIAEIERTKLFSEIELNFIDYKGSEKKYKLYTSDLKAEISVIEERLWKSES